MIESLTRQGISVVQACRPNAPRTLRRIWLAGEIADLHKASGGTYGSLRVTAELRHGRGIVVGHNASSRSCASSGSSAFPPDGYRKAHGSPRSPRSVSSSGRFDVICPNELSMTDSPGSRTLRRPNTKYAASTERMTVQT